MALYTGLTIYEEDVYEDQKETNIINDVMYYGNGK